MEMPQSLVRTRCWRPAMSDDPLLDNTAEVGLFKGARGPAPVVVESVGVRFGGLIALDDVSLRVPTGELTAIIGPNGAGKTTLLNAMSGAFRGQMVGRVMVSGTDVSGWRTWRFAAAGIARSFQHPPLIDSETVLENVMIGLHHSLGYNNLQTVIRPAWCNKRERQMQSLGMAALEFVGLARIANSVVGSVPYGARKLTDLARALVSSPRLIMLDEPTSGLGADAREDMSRILTSVLATKMTTLIVVEHHMDLVRAVANNVVGMQAGRVLITGSPSDVLDSDVFLAAIVGRSG